MPRIYTSANDPLDYCRSCFPNEQTARKRFGNKGAGPDDRGDCFEYDADHPSYESTDYRCHKCRKSLEAIDNYRPDECVPGRPWPLKPR